MAFKLGDKIIWHGHTDNLSAIIRSGTITKLGRETVWLDNKHKAEDQVYSCFLYPDTPECRQFLQDAIDMKARHKKEEDEFMKRTYEFNNSLIRAGLK